MKSVFPTLCVPLAWLALAPASLAGQKLIIKAKAGAARVDRVTVDLGWRP